MNWLLRVTCILTLSFLCNSASAQTLKVTDNLTTDPAKAPLVYDDVVNFLRVQDLLDGQADTMEVLQTEYLDKGTLGLKMFIEKYDLTAERMMKAMRKYPEKYSTLDFMPGAIDDMEPEARVALAKFKEFIPHAVFPPTYFLVAGYWGIGSGSVEGQLISVEKWTAPLDETTMLIHELTHFQQVVAVGYEKYAKLFNVEKSLLGLTIREGTAEFVAQNVVGDITQDEAVDYTREHEERLWKEFKEVMHGNETGDWMWSKPADSLQPRHVAYVLGSFICQSYYDHADDKAQALKDILGVTDYSAFLDKSRYAAKFER